MTATAFISKGSSGHILASKINTASYSTVSIQIIFLIGNHYLIRLGHKIVASQPHFIFLLIILYSCLNSNPTIPLNLIEKHDNCDHIFLYVKNWYYIANFTFTLLM